MGNKICGEICSHKKFQNEVSLPNMKTMKSDIETYDTAEIIKIQKFFRVFRIRKLVLQRFREIQNEKRRSMKELACEFKDSWELYFKNNTEIDFSINGLHKVKKEILDFYVKFFKISKRKNSYTLIKDNSKFKEKIIVLNEKKLFGVKTAEEFREVFHVPIFKIMNKYFSIGESNSTYEKINVEVERVKLSSSVSIEENNTLENEDNKMTTENNNEINNNEINNNYETTVHRYSTINNYERTDTNLNRGIPKTDSNIISINVEEEKVDEISDKKFQTLNANTIEVIKEENWNNNTIDNIIGINLNLVPNQNEIWLKKETYVSDFTRISSNKNLITNTTENHKGSVSPQINFKRSNNKIPTFSSHIESLNISPIRKIIINNYSDTQTDKVRLLNQSDEYIRSKSANVHSKKPQNGEVEIEMENIIESINTVKEKECNFISFKDRNSIFYQGNWNEKKLCKYGLGYAYMVNKNKGIRYKYYGYFKDELYHGIGLLLYEDGYYYCGEFRNGFQSGLGMEVTKNSSYVGFFKDGKHYGYGEYNYQGKIFFSGTFKNGMKDGYGLLTMNDGAKYCGSFMNNKMHGIGAFHWPAGHKYYGNWKDDKMHGLGYYKWAKGDYYIGYYENDLRHGYGEYHFKNESVLIGTWKNSKKEGKFELHESKNNFPLFYKNDVQVD